MSRQLAALIWTAVVGLTAAVAMIAALMAVIDGRWSEATTFLALTILLRIEMATHA